MFQFICRLWERLIGLFWLGRESRMEVAVVGLHKAGVTTYVNAISKIDCTKTKMRKVKYSNTSIKVWDLGGDRRFRRGVEKCCRGVHAIIFMVDAADGEKMSKARHVLHELLHKPQLMCVPVLIVGNKTDLPNAFSSEELIDYLHLNCVKVRKTFCAMVSCKKRDNIDITLQWLIAYSKRPK
ncbi:ADP-ribosylation factor-like protein 8B [Parasteatoda tepidariorum]|uniref:ADP-ribosylation factor-like protein 8B n=1 Tax=Parasteatoda tepidariorum TaxID=114398 RepID=UPI00077F995A|nr:ADP-ribosylation factor-like protein 8B [Parasteatoda tepidariorum]